MARKKLILWNNFEEIKADYIDKTPLGALVNPMSGRNLLEEQPQQPPEISPLSEYAMFEYAVNKIQTFVDEEIETLSDNSQAAAIAAFKKDKDTLINNFKKQVHKAPYGNTPVAAMEQIGKKFLADANVIIKKYEPQIESDKSWTPFLKNILLLLTVIGSIPALISMGNKAANGHYKFFDKASIDQTRLNEVLPSALVK